jgi:hypothetical protein
MVKNGNSFRYNIVFHLQGHWAWRLLRHSDSSFE